MAVIYACPADKRLSCPWEGYASDIKHHFEKEHGGLLYDNTSSIQIDLNISNESFLLCLQDHIYLVQSQIQQDDMLFLKLRFLGSATDAMTRNFDISVSVSNFHHKYRKENRIVKIIAPTSEGWQINLAVLREIHEDFDQVTCNVSVQQQQQQQSDDCQMVTKQESFKRIRISNSFIEKNVCDDLEDNYLDALSLLDHKLAALRANQSVDDIMDRISHLNFSMLEENSPRNRLSSAEDSKYSEYMESPNTEYLPDITEEIDLSCASCDSDMLPPIYLCINGHNVCVSCKSGQCKVCSGHITDIRNMELENVSRTQKHACRYTPNGCFERLPYNELRGHEIKCRYCKYRCYGDCGFEDRFMNFVNHLKIRHSSVKISNHLNNDFPKNHEFFIVSKDKGIFYCQSKESDSLITWTATYCGPKERRFFCELMFKGGKTKEPQFLKRRENVYELTKTKLELKKMKVKEKYAFLLINSYDN